MFLHGEAERVSFSIIKVWCGDVCQFSGSEVRGKTSSSMKKGRRENENIFPECWKERFQDVLAKDTHQQKNVGNLWALVATRQKPARLFFQVSAGFEREGKHGCCGVAVSEDVTNTCCFDAAQHCGGENTFSPKCSKQRRKRMDNINRPLTILSRELVWKSQNCKCFVVLHRYNNSQVGLIYCIVFHNSHIICVEVKSLASNSDLMLTVHWLYLGK